MRTVALTGIAVGMIFLAATITLAVPKKGDLFISDSQRDAIFVVDPVTGNRTILSASDEAFACWEPGKPFACCTGFHQGSGCGPAVGNGPELDGPSGIAVDSDGSLLIASRFLVQIFRVDPATGDRTIISGTDRKAGCNGPGDPYACCIGNNTGDGTPPCTTTGSGPLLINPQYLAVESSGDILISDLQLGVLRVDPATGDRSVVSGCTNLNCTTIIGSGLNFRRPRGIALEGDGSILVADGEDLPDISLLDGAVVRVDPTSGDRASQSGVFGGPPIIGSGPNFRGPWDLTLESAGDILVTDSDLNALFRVDPASGDRTILSGGGAVSACVFSGFPFPCCTGAGTGDETPPCSVVAAGPPFTFSNTGVGVLTVEEGGSIVVGQFDGPEFDFLGTVLRVDPLMGNRTVVSSPTVGTGPVLLVPTGITVATQDAPDMGVPALSTPGMVLFLLLLTGGWYALQRLRRA